MLVLSGFMKKRGKKGQIIGMPFVLIFSLILIAVALFVGFWVIKGFLERACQAEINLFVTDLQNEIIGVWQREEASKTITLAICNKIDSVCFTDEQCTQTGTVPDFFCQDIGLWKITGKENLFLWPLGTAEGYDTNTAWHIKCGTKDCLNIEKTICFHVGKGKVSIRLTKESGSPFVTISQPF